ncbi:MAG: DNA alkylation repair protein [Tunicatimonas sp.]|uniref:DNA alkylation repair protein n=1 Tax=Tunicatimonas sp. TaxID=1940096 RepID=UPI003C787306
MTAEQILIQLHDLADPAYLPKIQRFGILTDQALGIRIPMLRQLAKPYCQQHELALDLWDSGVHEAQILATLVDDHRQVTEEQLENWVTDIQSWDLCDQACSNLFWRTPFAYRKATEWCQRSEEFVKRTGFVLMTALVIHDKKMPEDQIIALFPYLEMEAYDNRNFVKKAINWMLRQTGKRSLSLNQQAINLAQEIGQQKYLSAQWIAHDALRELQSEKTQMRLK